MAFKILFADDDPLMRQLYGRYIESAGYEVVEATNRREAIEEAEREKPNLAVGSCGGQRGRLLWPRRGVQIQRLN